MTLAEYLRILRRRWMTVVAVTLVGIVAAAAMTAMMPQTYAATSTSFVTIARDSTDGTGTSLYEGSRFIESQIKSYAQVVDSPSVLRPVIDKLGLDMGVAQLRSKVTATSAPDTVLVDVAVTDRSAGRAAKISNAVSRQAGSVIEDLSRVGTGEVSLVKVTLTSAAQPPASPASPRPMVNLALGTLVGLALGIVLAVLREQLDTRIDGLDDVASVTSTKPLGWTEEIGDADGALVALERASSAAEGFRSLRTNLQFRNLDDPPRTLVVTSAVAGEGKTVTACNLAITLAQSGVTVCLLEVDLREPALASLLGLDGPGLTDVLGGEHDLDDALLAWGEESLHVLLAGNALSDPTDVLGSQGMSSLFRKVRERFDYVIVDTPPLTPFTADAVEVGRLTDGAILVMRQGWTKREELRRADEELGATNVPLMGTILTGVRVKRGPGHRRLRKDQRDGRQRATPPTSGERDQ